MKKYLIPLIAVLLIGGVIGGGWWWKTQQSTTPETTPEITPLALKATLASEKRLIKPDEITFEPLKIQPQIPSLSFPLDVSKINNFSRAKSYLNLDSSALEKLQNNGFVVTETKDLFTNLLPSSKFTTDHFEEFYATLQTLGKCEEGCTSQEKAAGLPVPIVITTDSVLHYYHLIFESVLLRMERELFFDKIWALDKALLEDSLTTYQTATDPLVKEAAKRNVAYFATGLSLLSPKESQITTAQRLKDKGEVGLSQAIEYQCGSNATCIRAFIEANLPNEFSRNDQEEYQFTIPDLVKTEVNQELQLIENHNGWAPSPIFIYREDYSQYAPRGHYTQGEKLKNYFQALMWHGRMTMLLKGSAELLPGQSKCLSSGFISQQDAKIQTLEASLIAQSFLNNKNIQEDWQKVYVITGFFVGLADDLGPYEYLSALNALFKGKEIDFSQVDQIQETLLAFPHNPKIYSGLGQCTLEPPFDSEQAHQYLQNTKGFRLLGQRYTIDSNIFSEIVSPYSGVYTGDPQHLAFTTVETGAGRLVRGFPRGLDLMSLLGSERAKYWLAELGDTNYTDYQKQFDSLKSQFDTWNTSDWYQSLYTSWLFTLKPLLEQFGTGYPSFMQNTSYQDKSLNTSLASWAQLRHDTILYTKQSYTMSERGGGPEELPPRGYVEPIPEFYNRLLVLTQMTEKGLKSLLTPAEWDDTIPSFSAGFGQNTTKTNVFDEFNSLVQNLLEISKTELANKPLTDEQYAFIDTFGDTSENFVKMILGNQKAGTGFATGDIYEGLDKILKSSIVADVHTDGNTQQVLEEGVGNVKAMVVAYELPDKRIMIGVGPVFSYYEFKQPIANRLTDEAWRQMLSTNPPPEPEWTKSFTSSK